LFFVCRYALIIKEVINNQKFGNKNMFEFNNYCGYIFTTKYFDYMKGD